MREATGDVLVRILYIQDTAGRLSHQMAMLECVRVSLSTDASRTSQWSSMPISSRSEMVRRPFRFEEVTRLFRTSVGHSQNQTIGEIWFVPPNHTPPTPHFDASTKP